MWESALSNSGFGGVDFFLDDYKGSPCSTVICATAHKDTLKVNGFTPDEDSAMTLVSATRMRHVIPLTYCRYIERAGATKPLL